MNQIKDEMSANNQKRLANDFTRTIWGMRAGHEFSVAGLHEKIQYDDPEIQDPEDYSAFLQIALQEGYIEAVTAKPATHRVKRGKRPKKSYYVFLHRLEALSTD